MNRTIWLWIGALAAFSASAQTTPPSVSTVVPYSTITSSTLKSVTIPAGKTFNPTTLGTINDALFSVYTYVPDAPDLSQINDPTKYGVATAAALSSALNSNIANALSLIPLSSPTSGVILKKDPLTGADLPASGTLGPIFTQRAETVGKGKVYVGVSHQSYHFNSLDGASLNGFSVLYKGGDPSGIFNGTARTAPATFNMALDVRLSQDLVFVTYGLTNFFDVSVGLPSVHSAVAATSYNGIVYSGTGIAAGGQCWCINTLTPGSFALSETQIGSASLSKTGIGDLALRLKGQVLERSYMSLSIGADLRFPTGDAKNYLGTGATSVKPFFALSLYSRPFAHGIVFAPHLDAGWQFSGKSVLGGTFTPTTTMASLDNGVTVPVPTAPLVFQKGFLPDVFSWSAGTEVALGRRNTLLLDVIGNEIGTIHGIEILERIGVTAPAPNPLPAGILPQSSGFVGAGKGSYGQYSGSFGYKVKIYNNLVASFQALVRFDDNGLRAHFVPLFGLGYSR